MFSIQYRKRNKGMSLVEIMVGLVIGLLGVLVIFQVFEQSEARKRTTTGANDAQENGLSAILAMERDIRQSGNGLATVPGNNTGSNPVLGCNLVGYNQNATPTALNYRLAPLVIIPNGPNGPQVGGVGVSDELITTYSTSSRMISPVAFTMSGNNAQLSNIPDQAGFAAGDIVLTEQTGQPCSLAQVSAINAAGLITLTTGTGYNHPAGLLAGAGGAVYSAPFMINFGTPTRNHYYVSPAPNYNLSVSNINLGPVAGVANTVTLADQIVSMKAQYGVDLLNTGAITWVDPTGPWAYIAANSPSQANLELIKAVRIAVIARSARMEGTQTGAACTTTTVAPVPWFGGTQVNLTANADWQCYRYKVFQTIVPLRNMIWSEP